MGLLKNQVPPCGAKTQRGNREGRAQVCSFLRTIRLAVHTQHCLPGPARCRDAACRQVMGKCSLFLALLPTGEGVCHTQSCSSAGSTTAWNSSVLASPQRRNSSGTVLQQPQAQAAERELLEKRFLLVTGTRIIKERPHKTRPALLN